MNKISILLCAVATLFVTTSCLKGGSSHGGSSSATEVGYYTSYAISDSGEVTPAYTNEKRVSVGLLIPNILNPVMEITLHSLQFDNKTAPQTLQFSNLDFNKTTANDGINYVIDAKDIIPIVGGLEYPDYKVKRLKASIGTKLVLDIEFETISYRVIFHSERWNNEPIICSGDLTTTNISSSTSEVRHDAFITISKMGTETESLNILFNGVSFAAGMPPLNITFPALAFKRTVNTNGITYAINAENVIPKIGNTEYPEYKVNYISAEIGSEKGSPVTIEFEMANMPYRVNFTNNINQ